MRFSAASPMRVIMRMFTTTYGLSLISTPQRANGESIGPMQYGITYMVRPLHRAGEQGIDLLVRFARIHPVIVRAGVFLVLRADEGQVLDARHVRGVGAVQIAIRVGVLVELDKIAALEHRSIKALFSASDPSHQ